MKRGCPRLENPSHHYSLEQWRQHQNQSPEQKALSFLKKFGLESLLSYSFSNLLKSVHGKKPKCFAMGDWNTLSECQVCEQKDSTSAEGFFDLEGKEIGPDCYGVFVCCWIASWVRKIAGKI